MDEMKVFKVELEIEAPNEKAVDAMLERMPHSDRILSDKITDEDAPYYQVRIRYDEDWRGDGEHFVFEGKWTNEDEWGLDTAFKLFDYKGEKGVLLNYQCLTKIRELNRMQIPFYFK